MTKRILPWHIGGVLLGACFFLAIWLYKPIGASSHFITVVRFMEGWLLKGLGKGRDVEIPSVFSEGFVFMVMLMLGSFMSSKLFNNQPKEKEKQMPAIWQSCIGGDPYKRYILVFFSGFLVFMGARIADGCTSGHMMSGLVQTAISGYVFTPIAFAIGIPLALWFYQEK